MLCNHLSNYHYLLTKNKLLKFSIKYMMLLYLGLLLWLITFCRGCMCTSKLPDQASLSWVPKSGQVKKLLRVFHLCRVYSLFLAKTRMLSLPLIHYFLPLVACNRPQILRIILSEFSLEAIFASGDEKSSYDCFCRRIRC